MRKRKDPCSHSAVSTTWLGLGPGLGPNGLWLAVFLTGLGLSAPSNGAERRPLALADYYRVAEAGSPAISPDGRWVAFVRTAIVEAENRRHSEIWLASTDGATPPRRLTHPSFDSRGPRWSPDGKLLAFTSRRPLPEAPATTDEGLGRATASNVWFLSMDSSSGEAFEISGVGGTPLFSPDNRWIAFVRATPPASHAERRTLSDEERLLEERFDGRIYDWMNYRFNGRGYLPDPRDPSATPSQELFLVPRSGGEPLQLTRMGVDVRSPVWAPDSSALVFVADSHQRDEHNYGRADVWRVDRDGETRRLTDDAYQNSSPVFSPVGSSLVFRRQLGLNAVIEAGQDRGAPVDLYRLSLDSGELSNLTVDWDLRPGVPSWSADGRSVRFAAGIGGNSHLFEVPAPGGTVTQVTTGDRRLSSFSFAADGERTAFVATDPTHPPEIVGATLSKDDERRLSAVNRRLLSEVDLQPAVTLRYPSADGTEIEGWLLLPAGYAPGSDMYPMILAIHGGPHGAYGHRFSFQFQLWAAQGYAVLYTNPRGSSGYGHDFLYATWGGWGILDTQDVLAGVDHALANYPIDARRLGVTGYSYGGFLTNWILGHSTRFAAAVSGAGIANWVSDYGTADIPRTKESEFYGPPWEPRSAELLIELSPITHIKGVSTPTLFIHGEADHRVPIEEAEQMYTALHKQRVAARFVRYPGMAHGGWTPWNTVHRYHQELLWWREYFVTAAQTAPSP